MGRAWSCANRKALVAAVAKRMNTLAPFAYVIVTGEGVIASAVLRTLSVVFIKLGCQNRTELFTFGSSKYQILAVVLPVLKRCGATHVVADSAAVFAR